VLRLNKTSKGLLKNRVPAPHAAEFDLKVSGQAVQGQLFWLVTGPFSGSDNFLIRPSCISIIEVTFV
jgi:hypothetical protein